jgi:hypothetical protein
MSESSTDQNIDDIILYQRKQVNKEKARMEEAHLLREIINDDNPATEFIINSVADGSYELTIGAQELTSGIHDVLGMRIVSDANIEDVTEGVEITADLDYQPFNVASELHH